MARLRAGTVAVRGLDELRRELRKLADGGATQALKDANYRVAEAVVAGARGRASTPMQRAAAATLRPSRAAVRAQVSYGAGIDFAMGAEFGAARNQLRNTSRGIVEGWNQFLPWRGSAGDAGYFLWPTIRDETDEIIEMYGRALDEITRAAFPGVRKG